MASQYCPYCMLTKTKWTEFPDKCLAGIPWTLQRLEEMVDDTTKKGAQKLGVECLPKLNAIDVDGIVLPLTHIGLGIDNDILAAFEEEVEYTNVRLPPDDVQRRQHLKVLQTEIENKQEAVRSFDATPKGKEYEQLQQQHKDAGKVMSPDELCLLSSLTTERETLRRNWNIAKQNNDAIVQSAAQASLDAFDKDKTRGECWDSP